MTLTLYDEFAGFGGSSQGATSVPGVELVFAANHWPKAIATHALNFPNADHFEGDVVKADITRFPAADIFLASPACPAWSVANGEKRTFDRSNQGAMFDEELGLVVTDHELNRRRSRALMEEVPRYLDAMALRGKPVLAGVVENVIQCRKWDDWHNWLTRIRAAGPGYTTRVIAYNSMHARPTFGPWAPQSRDRLYVAYWQTRLGRTPDWRKWLSPRAWCPTCETVVNAVQVFKSPRVDMGRYGPGGQYLYRCPNTTCRNSIVEPDALPAAFAIDWTLPPGPKIKDRPRDADGHPLKPATLARIETGLRKFAGRPVLAPAGGTWRTAPVDLLQEAMPARTTRESDGVAIPPLLVPVEGRDGKKATPITAPGRTQTGRRETALVIPPFVTTLRGGGSKTAAHNALTTPIGTFSAAGLHHGLTQTPDAQGIRWDQVLLSYYGNGSLHPVTEPVGTLPTRDRYAVLDPAPEVGDCTFRMLEPHEIAAGMAFHPTFQMLPGMSKRDRVRGLGNAVTPPVMQLIVSALVEAITGEDLERDPAEHGTPPTDGGPLAVAA